MITSSVGCRRERCRHGPAPRNHGNRWPILPGFTDPQYGRARATTICNHNTNNTITKYINNTAEGNESQADTEPSKTRASANAASGQLTLEAANGPLPVPGATMTKHSLQPVLIVSKPISMNYSTIVYRAAPLAIQLSAVAAMTSSARRWMRRHAMGCGGPPVAGESTREIRPESPRMCRRHREPGEAT